MKYMREPRKICWSVGHFENHPRLSREYVTGVAILVDV